ncbi:MAG TPA: deoxyribodipyrimidine photo-lyase [Opitutaceae bacterium]
MSLETTILWFRQDLRLEDNPALAAAVTRGGPIVPIYIMEESPGPSWPPGAAARWWLHHSLTAMGESLRARGSRLIVMRGAPQTCLPPLAARVGAGAVYWNRRYEPAGIRRDAAVESALVAAGLEVRSFNAALLFEPVAVANRQGRPFQVFTPFWRHCLGLSVPPPGRRVPKALPAPAKWPASPGIDALELLPRIPWDGGLREQWIPGEAGARRRLRRFAGDAMETYAGARDLPAQAGTSRLSPHLHFGEIGPRQIWAAVREAAGDSGVFPPGKGAGVFLRELGWREFAHHLLYHFPDTPSRSLRAEFDAFPWAEDRGGAKLRAWQRGRTGYPIVDAGMRELWTTGWMHNRVRMIVASFLVKHLRLPWALGAAWFWDTLVDADLANNTLGWQWSAGCGADAAPYFRVFNPVLQGERFDRGGAYVRRWVPELGGLPDAFVHQPWAASPVVLAKAGVVLGETYPRPLVDHATARAEALAAFQQMRALTR